MKTICWLSLSLLATAGYCAERPSRPPLFAYQPDRPAQPSVPRLAPEDGEVALMPAPAPDRREYRKSEFEKGPKKTWVDSAPFVVWISGIKRDGMFVTEIGDGHLSFFSSGKRLIGYHKRW